MTSKVVNYKPEVWQPGSKLTAEQMTALSAAVDQVEETVLAKLDVPNSVSAFVGEKVAELVNSAPETLDTLGELAAALEEKQDAISALNKLVTDNKTAIGLKADKAEYEAHVKQSDASIAKIKSDIDLKADKTVVDKKAESADLTAVSEKVTALEAASAKHTEKLINVKSVGTTKIDHDGVSAFVTSIDSNAQGTMGSVVVESQKVRIEVSEKHKDAKKISSIQLSKDELRLIRRDEAGTIVSVEVGDIDKAIKAVPTLATKEEVTKQLAGKLDSSAAFKQSDADKLYLGKMGKAESAKTSDSAMKATQDGNGAVIAETYATKVEIADKLDASKAFTKEAADKLYALTGHNHDSVYAKTTAIADMLTKTEAGTTYAAKSALADKVDSSVYDEDKKTFALKSELAGKLDVASAFKQSDADKLYVKVTGAFTQVAADKLYAAIGHNHDAVYAKTTAIADMLTKTEAGKLYLGKSEKASSATVADSATKAIQDGNGAVIAETYVAKSVYEAKVKELEDKLKAIESRLTALESPKP